MKPLLSLAVSAGCLLFLAACGKPDLQAGATTPSEPVASSAPAVAPALLVVDDPSKVCMVNDEYMNKQQIPVVVDGKTYFGCCAMCKEKLEKQASARTGIDPVTGKPVDKASAVIGRNAAGKVFYFENEGTLRRYAP